MEIKITCNYADKKEAELADKVQKKFDKNESIFLNYKSNKIEFKCYETKYTQFGEVEFSLTTNER